MQPTHLDLFSGIGGFALAAKWAGFRTVGFCEIDEWCRKILAKRFLADAGFKLMEGRAEQSWKANSDNGVGSDSIITTSGACQWLPEPDVGRVAHGVSNRVDRLKGLGNAIVPQVAFKILKPIHDLIVYG